MTKYPLVSIIMNGHNAEKYLREAIESVLAQTYSNWELIFWDNQSSDSSKDIFLSYKDKRLKYFQSKSYTKLGEARNNAIQNSEGELIAFLDCDDLWYPRKLAKQIPLFEQNEIGIATCNSIFFNEKRQIRKLYRWRKPDEGYVFKGLLDNYNISLETVIIRKSFLIKLDQWFDKRFDVIEEFDLFVRLSKISKLAYIDDVLAKWRVHSSSWTWKSADLFPIELRLFLKKMKSLYPNFNSDFHSSINAIERKIIILESLSLWEKGKVNKARNKLKKIISKDINALIILIFTYLLGYKIFNIVNKARVGLI